MIRDSLANDIRLIIAAIKINDTEMVDFLFTCIKSNIRRIFKGCMPKKYLIFPQLPEIYFLSRVLCFEFPSWGSLEYRNMLVRLTKKLSSFCVLDIQYFDGKTTFMIRDIKDMEVIT